MVKYISEPILEFFYKTFIPSIIAVGVSLAIQIKVGKKVTFLSGILSAIIGVGSAYMASDFVHNNFEDHQTVIAISLITLIGEKIGYWLIFQFKISEFLDSIATAIKDFVVNKTR